ncbi:UNVERIFIED_CONTAM: hypothetical protein GTU68_007257 [Idotea baltica]|nr:hypothetical protein [Idotea baltica]
MNISFWEKSQEYMESKAGLKYFHILPLAKKSLNINSGIKEIKI